MSDLTSAYRQLARHWTHHELSEYYGATMRGCDPGPHCGPDPQIRGPVAMLATAVPPCAALSVSIRMIHVLPATADAALVDRLLEHAETSSAIALRRLHHALELDGRNTTTPPPSGCRPSTASPRRSSRPRALTANRPPWSSTPSRQSAGSHVRSSNSTRPGPTPQRRSSTGSGASLRSTSSLALHASLGTMLGRSCA
jgi:hypothetical protein